MTGILLTEIWFTFETAVFYVSKLIHRVPHPYLLGLVFYDVRINGRQSLFG